MPPDSEPKPGPGSALKLGALLRQRKARMMTIESCTGGGVAHAVTELPGSSEWFDRGLVTYSNTAKTKLAGVPESLIEKKGAVSLEVAKAMAVGGLANHDLDCLRAFSVAITGVAGPGGGSFAKPVGLVIFAWAQKYGNEITVLKSSREQFSGDRQSIRRQSVRFAIDTLVKLLER